MPYDAHENKWDSPFGFRRKPPEEKDLPVCYKCLRDPPGESVPLFIVYLVRIFKIVSIISDAGTPGISDPGVIIVNECIKQNINIFPVPGPSAVSSAVSVSGFSEKYFFYGFFPDQNKDLIKDLSILGDLDCSIVFFISPKKINKAIEPLKKHFSGRKILICREISKFYEEYLRTSVDNLELYEKIPKGEITIIISEKINEINKSNNLDESDKKSIKKMIKILSIKDIIDIMTKKRDVSKKEIYNYCLKLKDEK